VAFRHAAGPGGNGKTKVRERSPRADLHGTLIRPRLLGPILEASRKGCVTLLHAPPGYGKSTLLAQAAGSLRDEGVHVATCDGEGGSGDPARLLGQLTGALVESDRRFAALCGPGSATPRELGRLLGEILRGTEHRVAIIMDDLHRVTQPEARRAITSLVENLPRAVSFLAATRQRPAIGLARLNLLDRVNVLSAEALAFTEEETCSWLSGQAGRELASEARAQAKGWPVALHLMKRHLQSRGGGGITLAAPYAPLQEPLAEYFSEQVLGEVPPRLADAALWCAVPDRICAQLAASLLPGTDGAAVLRDIEESQLFLEPALSDGVWRAFHPMFARYLRDCAERKDKRLMRAAHRRACEWFSGNGYLFEAVTHANAAGDAEMARDVLIQAGGWRLLLKSGPRHFRVFRELTHDIVSTNPSLWLGQIYVLIRDRNIDAARSQLEGLLRTLDCDTSAEARIWHARALTLGMVLKFYAGEPMTPHEESALAQAYASPSVDDDHVAAAVGNAIAWLSYQSGDFPRCAAVAGRALQSSANGMPFLQSFTRLTSAMSLVEMGQLDEAVRIMEAAPKAGDVRIAECELTGRLLKADIASEGGDDALAREYLWPVLAELDSGEQLYEINALAYRTAFSLASRDEIDGLARRCQELALSAAQPRLLILGKICWALRAMQLMGRDAALRAEHHRLLFGDPGEALADWRVQTARTLARSVWALLHGRFVQALDEALAFNQRLQDRSHLRYMMRAAVVVTLAHQELGQRADADRCADGLLDLAAKTSICAPLLQDARRLAPLLESAASRSAGEPLRLALAEEVLGRVRKPAPDADATAPRAAEGLLSLRESEVLSAMAGGLTSKETARQLGISINTVMFHRKNLYRKLNCASRSKVVSTARSLGLLTS